MARLGAQSVTFGISTQTAVIQVLNISGPSISRDTIDTTDADATNNWRTFIASYIDGGELTLEFNYDPDNATHTKASNGLLNGFTDGILTYKLSLSDPTPTTYTFSGLLVGWEVSAPHDGVLTVSATIKVMGEITFG